MNRLNSKSPLLYYLIAVIVVGIWGLTFISTKILITSGLTAHEIFLLRFSIAYLGMWFLAPKRLWAENWKDEGLMLLGGVAGGSLYFLTENIALGITMVNNVAFIVCSAPLLTTFLMLLFYKSEKASKRLFAGSLIALTGVALVIYNGSFVLKLNPLGDFLALSAALSWAFYCVIMNKLSQKYSTKFLTRKIFFYGLLTILPVFFVSPWRYELSKLTEPVILFNLLFLAILASLVCFAVWNFLLKKLGTVQASNVNYLNPIFTMIGSAAFLGEPMTVVALTGAVFILGGVYISSRRK